VTAPLVNPYDGVDFGAVTARPGVSHMHPDSPAPNFTTALGYGARIMAWSNYFPEEPIDPAAFGTAPGDVVFLDNTEQHTCTDTNLHYCPLGSTQSHDGGTHMPWREAFDEALGLLEVEDGGGITLNHPIWSGNTDIQIKKFLDHDPDRVLGIEIYNHMTNNLASYATWQKQPAYPMWDRLLASGRRCWGFMAHDHYDPSIAPYLGFNMLLMDALTAESALRCYRSGAFYTTMSAPGSGLALTGFTVADHAVTVTTDAATTLTMVTDLGNSSAAGPAHTFDVPAGAVYARFEATGLGDTLRTQPLMYSITPPRASTDGARARRRRFVIGS
jgi:hypothetical protein